MATRRLLHLVTAMLSRTRFARGVPTALTCFALLPLCTAALSITAMPRLRFQPQALLTSRFLQMDGSGDVAECSQLEFDGRVNSIFGMCASCVHGLCPPGCCVAALASRDGQSSNQFYLCEADKCTFQVLLKSKMTHRKAHIQGIVILKRLPRCSSAYLVFLIRMQPSSMSTHRCLAAPHRSPATSGYQI
jgi:hypothetical protein